jgi:hypothetical protein
VEEFFLGVGGGGGAVRVYLGFLACRGAAKKKLSQKKLSQKKALTKKILKLPKNT